MSNNQSFNRFHMHHQFKEEDVGVPSPFTDPQYSIENLCHPRYKPFVWSLHPSSLTPPFLLSRFCVSSLSLFPVIYICRLRRRRGYVLSLATNRAAGRSRGGGMQGVEALNQPTACSISLAEHISNKATNAWSARVAAIVHDNWKSRGYEPAAFSCDLLLLRIYYFREDEQDWTGFYL